MSIWDAFGKGRYKGFSREAGQLLDKAVELAGGLGCKKADTGHLLWAMLQADGGPAARFLAGKNSSELYEGSTVKLKDDSEGTGTDADMQTEETADKETDGREQPLSPSDALPLEPVADAEER